jgi:hypothetical protein
MNIKNVNLYQVNDFFVIVPLDTTIERTLLESMIFLKISINSSSELIYSNIIKALELCKSSVENPKDWSEDTKERNRELKRIGLKSQSDLYKIGNKFCFISEYNDRIEIVPSKNNSKRKFFAHLPDLSEVYIKGNSQTNFIELLNKVFLKCQ